MTTNGGLARLLRVHGLWIVLVTCVVMAAGFGVSRTAPIEYKAAATVVVEARVRANTTPVPPDMGTEKELAQSGLVVDPAAQSLGVDPGHMLNGLTISVAPDANVLTIAYTHADPATAQRRAQALAESYVAYRNAGEAQESSTSAAKRAAATTSTQHATLVTPAGLPSVPVERPVWIDVSIGLVIGLLLGIGTALIRDRTSDRIRGRSDFERVAGATVLATVPRVRRPRGTDASLPVTLRAPGSPAAESFRYLRSRLQPMLRDGAATILVTSAGEREGRTTTAANLATALAQAGRNVILVDADLRRPGLHDVFGVKNERGLTDLLTGTWGVTDVLRDGPVPRLRLLTAGPHAGRASDLLEGPRLARTLRAVQKQCDIVVLDSAPVLSISDAIALAAISDQILLVGDYRRTTRGYVTRALTELGEVVDGNVSGVLLNAPKSAGGLTPRGRGEAAAAPIDVVEPVELLDAGAGPADGGERHAPAFVPPIVPKASAPASTVYSSASAAELSRLGDGTPVPAERAEPERPLERHN
jgi:capsular exopolysaccharide synthesis family protein